MKQAEAGTLWKNELEYSKNQSQGTCQSQGSSSPWIQPAETADSDLEIFGGKVWRYLKSSNLWASWNYSLWSVWSKTPLNFSSRKQKASPVVAKFLWSDAWGTAGACRWRLVWTLTRSRQSGMPVASLSAKKSQCCRESQNCLLASVLQIPLDSTMPCGLLVSFSAWLTTVRTLAMTLQIPCNWLR